MTNFDSGINLRAFKNTLRRASEKTDNLYRKVACDLLVQIINSAYDEGTISVNEIAVMVEAKVQDTDRKYWVGNVIE